MKLRYKLVIFKIMYSNSTEDKMVGWHHCLNGHEFEEIPGDSEGQGSLECCSPWNHRVRHDLATEQQQIGFDVLFK